MDPFNFNYNQLVTNKMRWMARNLRYHNDPVSIMNWTNAMASLKNLLLFPPRNLADPLKEYLSQPAPILSLSKADYISCNSQPLSSKPDNHQVNLDISTMCHAIDKHSTSETIITSSPLSEGMSTVPAIVQESSSFGASRFQSHVKKVSKKNKQGYLTLSLLQKTVSV